MSAQTAPKASVLKSTCVCSKMIIDSKDGIVIFEDVITKFHSMCLAHPNHPYYRATEIRTPSAPS